MTLAAVDGIFTLLSPENIRTLLGSYSGQEIPDESRPLSPIGLAQAGSQIADNGYVNLFSLLAFVNVFLAVFNAIPLIPLDGGRVLLSLIAPTPLQVLQRFLITCPFPEQTEQVC